MNELEKCPFCGQEVIEVVGDIRFFKCTNKKCGAVTSFDQEYYNHHPEETRTLWNRRIK